MNPIPQQRTYERVATINLQNRLEELAGEYWNLQDQLAALELSRNAIRNVLAERRHAAQPQEAV